MSIRKLFARKPSVDELREARDIDGLVGILDDDKLANLHIDAMRALGEMCDQGIYIREDQILEEGGPRIAEPLVRTLEHSRDQDTKATAGKILSTLPSEPWKLAVIDVIRYRGLSDDTFLALTAYLRDVDEKVKEHAFLAIMDSPEQGWKTQYAEPIIALMPQEEDVRALVARTLCDRYRYARMQFGRRWRPALGEAFLTVLPDCTDDVKLLVIQTFVANVDSDDFARNVVSVLLQDERERIRLAAINAYGSALREKAIRNGMPLIDALWDQDRDIQLAAIAQLRKGTIGEAIEPLSDLARKSEDDHVRDAAMSAANELGAEKRKLRDLLLSEEGQAAVRKVMKDFKPPEFQDDKYDEMKRAYESDGSGQSPYHDK